MLQAKLDDPVKQVDLGVVTGLVLGAPEFQTAIGSRSALDDKEPGGDISEIVERIMSNKCCEGVRPAKFSRRYFMKQGGIGLVGLSTVPAFLQRAIAATPAAGKKQLVVLFQRGAADGLNIVVPFGEPNYYRMRPRLPFRSQGAEARMRRWTSTDFSDCIPSLAPFVPLFQKNQLAIVHAAGSPDPTRSHFDAQDYMESGTPGVKATEDGWLDRAIGTIPEENASPFRAVAMGPNLPRMLRGSTGRLRCPICGNSRCSRNRRLRPTWSRRI